MISSIVLLLMENHNQGLVDFSIAVNNNYDLLTGQKLVNWWIQQFQFCWRSRVVCQQNVEWNKDK